MKTEIMQVIADCSGVDFATVDRAYNHTGSIDKAIACVRVSIALNCDIATAAELVEVPK